MTKRIAMWSGPRNISTAMMRSWENRQDCSAVDEPFYAYYLHQTQSPHPMFEEILASQSIHFEEVSQAMSNGNCSSVLQYQKHMTHHMLPGCDLAWTKDITHCFLIREPAYVVNSYTNSRGLCSADDIGIKRQHELYEAITAISGQDIPVIDSDAVLRDPESSLRKICSALKLEFDPNMLNWPAGKRESDGVWASHWYKSVESSTHFAPAKQQTLALNDEQLAVVEEVTPYYQQLKQYSLI
ncbi:HAD family hydrolase [Glaciecola sp. SC05]|uniref:sulfotransferase-like domain-containing protein n=1 Tax=Glaciecola sp. SC05 TaxID=1987355 RepID=UPI0035295B8F